MTIQNLIKKAMQAEMLDPETELMLANRWRDERDERALRRLTTAHLRFAIAIALRYKHCGVKAEDLVQEASVGLMKAADRFDPDRGVRFVTYARYWIKATIQSCLIQGKSLVRFGSSNQQKTLYFNLHKAEKRILREAAVKGEVLSAYELCLLMAKEFNLPVSIIEQARVRLAHTDFSLDASQTIEGEHGSKWIDFLKDPSPSPEDLFEEQHDGLILKERVREALEVLTERERYVVIERRLLQKQRTLESLGQELKLSKERVRQIEAAAFMKMRKRLAQSREIQSLL